MEQDQAAKISLAITGSFQPAAESSTADLAEARAAISRSILDGTFVPGNWFRALGLPQPPTQAAQPGRDLVTLRILPVQSDLDPFAPPSLRGMGVTRTLGPFVDAAGRRIWADLVTPMFGPTTKTVALFIGNDTTPFMIVPVTTIPTPPGAISLGAGSLWLVSRILATNAPQNGFSGFRIKGGTLKFSHPPTVNGNIVRFPAATSFDLQVNLDLPATPPVVTGPGEDATDVVCNLPASVAMLLKNALRNELVDSTCVGLSRVN
jgi:hypothetical protein